MLIQNIDIDYQFKHDYKTPQDNRTRERKILVQRVKDMREPYFDTDYGIWAYLTGKHIKLFLTFNNN